MTNSMIIGNNWIKYAIEILTMSVIIGLPVGIVIGFIRGFDYISNGFFFPFLDSLKFSINWSIFLVLLLLFFFILLFLIFRGFIKNLPRSCFLSSAIALLPFFMLAGYKINKAYISGFFEFRLIFMNLLVGLGFVLTWFLISLGLLSWTRKRIISAPAISMKGLSSLVGLVLIFNVFSALSARLNEDGSPNVIILLIDALRADHLSSYGYHRNTTPNIDRFAEDSVVFTQAISQSTYTKTSIASLFTSLYPYQHAVYEGSITDPKQNITSDILGEEEKTLAETLLQNGLLTVAWVQNVQLRSYMGFDQGFIQYDEPAGTIKSINKKFIRWTEWIGKKYRFFGYLHYLDLHDPYRPKPPYDTMYGIYSNVYSDHDVFSNYGRFIGGVRKKTIQLEGRDVEQLKAYYDGLLTYIDSQIGLILEGLKKEGLYDKSLIILTADHGDGFMEHGFISHSFKPYEELVRVPLIIKFPKSLHAGKVVKSQVRLIDVMPTILDSLNIKYDGGLSGISLLNYLRDNGTDEIDLPKYAFSELSDNNNSFYALSIRSERHKYIHFHDNKDELYDLVLDPGEQDNIIDLKRDLAEEFRRVATFVVSERDKSMKKERRVTIDKEAIDDLKALGYIQ